MPESAFRIKYGAVNSLDGPGVEDLEGIKEFQEDMSSSYVTLLKPTLQERGGEAYQFIVEWFSKHSFKEYMEIIGAYLLAKASDKIIDSLLDKYLFNPFKKAYKKLLSRNSWRLGIYTFSMEFSDTSVSISSFSQESIIENLERIQTNLYNLYEILKDDARLPLYISIPIVKDQINGIDTFRYLTEKDELLFNQKDRNLYDEYWVIFYHLSERYFVYDVRNRKLIPIEKLEYVQ